MEEERETHREGKEERRKHSEKESQRIGFKMCKVPMVGQCSYFLFSNCPGTDKKTGSFKSR